MTPWLVEPRRKTCRTKAPCGRCANCQRDAWSDIWHRLTTEDKAWVVRQIVLLAMYSGELMSDGGAKAHIEPSMCRYVLC